MRKKSLDVPIYDIIDHAAELKKKIDRDVHRLRLLKERIAKIARRNQNTVYGRTMRAIVRFSIGKKRILLVPLLKIVSEKSLRDAGALYDGKPYTVVTFKKR